MLSSLFRSKAGKASDLQSTVQSNTAFALDLYSQLKASPGNLFFSPYSVSTALAMTYAGARGETEKQIARVLHFDADQKLVHRHFGEFQHQLTEAGKQESIQLNVANALWAQKGHPFRPAFLKVARDNYQASVEQADFVAAAEAVRGEINHWVAERTKDKIQDILPPGSLNDLTRLVLANAIYFKGLWKEPFDRSETSMQPFYLLTPGHVLVPLMHHFDEVRYTENNEFQAVELPYQGNQLSNVVLLPRQMDGVIVLENRLTSSLLSDTLRQKRKRSVEIFLPRFKLESGFDLNDTLARMGIPDAFQMGKADFSGMDGIKFLFISDVFHRAWAEVNEEGTEAAAATITAMAGCADMNPPPPPPVFRADHPFIFLIRDTRSGSILFLGRFMQPAGGQ